MVCLSIINSVVSAGVEAADSVCVSVNWRSLSEIVPGNSSGTLIQCVLSVHLVR